MNPNKALWEKGDLTRLAQTMRESGEAVVEPPGVGPGMKALDLRQGDGATALPAARAGADVLGVDIAANLVAAGNARAGAAGLANLRFQEGDAADGDRPEGRRPTISDCAFSIAGVIEPGSGSCPARSIFDRVGRYCP